jgi:hypothetical protein
MAGEIRKPDDLADVVGLAREREATRKDCDLGPEAEVGEQGLADERITVPEARDGRRLFGLSLVRTQHRR